MARRTGAKKERPAKPKANTKTVKFGQGEIEVPDVPEVDVDEQQPPLVPLSEEELKTAGRKLAQKVRDLEDMTTAHQGRRAEMKASRTALRDEISAIATTVRTQGR